jgi:hypothetical protein
MAATSFSFLNGSPIIVRDHHRVSLHILLFAASKQRMRRLAVQIPVLVLDAARGSHQRHMMGDWTLAAKLRTVVVRRTHRHEVVLLRQGQGCARRLTDSCSAQHCAD